MLQRIQSLTFLSFYLLFLFVCCFGFFGGFFLINTCEIKLSVYFVFFYSLS